MDEITTTRFMREYLNPGHPVLKPFRLTKHDEPYCDIYPVTDKVAATIPNGVNKATLVYQSEQHTKAESGEFAPTHSGQCASCHEFSSLMMAMIDTADGPVARLVCKNCWMSKGKKVGAHQTASDMTPAREAHTFRG